MRTLVCLAIAFLALALSLTLPVSAQTVSTATLSGRISDHQGRVVPGALVTLADPATGTERTTETNMAGDYVLPNLAIGTYSMRVSKTGFESSSVDVTLRVGENRAIDLALPVASPAENVTVSDRLLTASIDRSSAVDSVIIGEELADLPLNGRNYLELAFLIPGSSPAPNFDPTKTNSVLISSAGQLGRGSNITIDGLDNNDDVVGGPLQNISQGAVEEFQIATNRFSAEMGRSGSSVINVVTKSGTNEVHGSASLFARDSRIQALPATVDRSVADDFPFDRQQYAGSLGGPIRANSAWWFASVERRNQDGALLVGERDAASRSIRRGFATAPLDDLMITGRADWNMNDSQRFNIRYSAQDAEDIAASTLIRSLGSASQRQTSQNEYHSLAVTSTTAFSPSSMNTLSFGFSTFDNAIDPLVPGPQKTYPSLQDGASFRVPQQTRQNRLQFSDSVNWVLGSHSLQFGGEIQKVDGDFVLDVFREGRIEFVEDFPAFDRNGDGATDDNDLLFAVTLRSAFPDRSLVIPDADNNHVAFFVQDNFRLTTGLSLNLGLRYELDTDVKNVSRFDEINPLVQPFLSGERKRDTNNWAPRIGLNWATRDGRTSVYAGYGIYYDRIVLQIQSLERGLDGRALPVEVRAGNVFFMDQETGQLPPVGPTAGNPFTGFLLPGAGAAGINIIDNQMQNPMVQQFNLGVARKIAGYKGDLTLRADFLHDLGTHFIIGRTVGTVHNPVVDGPDFVVNLESSVNTKYDALLLSAEQLVSGRYHVRASYTLSKAFNYANDDQIPFANGPIDPNNLRLEYGPTPNDQRHRFAMAVSTPLPGNVVVAGIWNSASGVPMDILMPDARTRIPVLQRNAGGRLFRSGSELNQFLGNVNAQGGVNGTPLPLVSDDARFSDSFHSLDLRLSRPFRITEKLEIEPLVEVFNVFNITNVLGVSNLNYSGYSNVLIRDSADPASPGFLTSSQFGRPVSTAGGVFGSGGPRAFQFAVRASF